MSDDAKKVWKVMEKYGWSEPPVEFHLEYFEDIVKATKEALGWTLVEKELPDELETVWISNGKGWTTLGCRVPDENGWHWAESNGVIYQQANKIMSECESDDLDVRFWQRLPEPPLFRYSDKY